MRNGHHHWVRGFLTRFVADLEPGSPVPLVLCAGDGGGLAAWRSFWIVSALWASLVTDVI
jgi:hypothetical protein